MSLSNLNLPTYNYRIRNHAGMSEIFDPIRKKFVALTPEEWVRQNFINFLSTEKQVPLNLMRVEVSLLLNNMQRRSDIVIYNRQGRAIAAVECKADSVKITQETFDQLTRYNIVLQVPYLIVTNGMLHYCCAYNSEKQQYVFVKDIPTYQLMTVTI